MTRVNLIDPSLLHRQHLLAEYMELPRVFTLVTLALHRTSVAEVCASTPQSYVLGAGHIKFFYNKLLFLNNRQLCIIKELRHYDYILNFTRPLRDSFSHLPLELWNDYMPDESALDKNIARLYARKPDHYAYLMRKV